VSRLPYFATRLDVLLSIRGEVPVSTRDVAARNPSVSFSLLVNVLAWLYAAGYVERAGGEGWLRTGKALADLRSQAAHEAREAELRRDGHVACTRCGVLVTRNETVRLPTGTPGRYARMCLTCVNHRHVTGVGA
jgi:hypothetical protein